MASSSHHTCICITYDFVTKKTGHPERSLPIQEVTRQDTGQRREAGSRVLTGETVGGGERFGRSQKTRAVAGPLERHWGKGGLGSVASCDAPCAMRRRLDARSGEWQREHTSNLQQPPLPGRAGRVRPLFVLWQQNRVQFQSRAHGPGPSEATGLGTGGIQASPGSKLSFFFFKYFKI